MATGTIRVGVIGAGANTRLHHIPKLQAIDGVEVVAVANRSRESSERVAKEFGIPQIRANWQEIIEDDGLDAVVIGTWPYMHRTMVLAALHAGKHVLTEARMAMNLEEAKEMLAAARAKPNLVAQIVPSPMTFPV
ncbi:MAG TPA: Gfo/Idh/MocA family oxidoreductase, partial [Dehalococcoidia bacterium]|nr:Gfo/Idh/MocA family oxidoreductase [Dehalococcoidia bacterium]